MATSNNQTDLERANFRRCRLCTWPNYGGLGFNLENSNPPPHLIRTIESNSPASAGGLKILDLVLSVNNQDVSNADYRTVTQAIKNARDDNDRIELLVIEKRFYNTFKNKGIDFDPRFARTIDTPTTMPHEYTRFPKYTPRTCDIRLGRNEESFGFEIVNGTRDVGAFIQEVIPNSPAGRTTLRKSDRILEVDDKFVDNESSKGILERLAKGKKKRAVKLYVVDTNTYKYFKENQIPLSSKEYQKSNFARQQKQLPSGYINVEDIPDESERPDVTIPRPAYPAPILPDNRQSEISESMSSAASHQDDIRLCTITRIDATDTYGIELNYHRRDQYHSLKLASGRNNTPSNAAMAGVKTDDHLIEINGENIENIGDDPVKQRIRAVKYPQPLQLLVADSATYNYYKQQNKVIHSGLPTVRKLPGNLANRTISVSSSHQEITTRVTSTAIPVPVEDITSTTIESKKYSIVPTGISTDESETDRRQYQLKRIAGVQGYGFSVNSNQAGSTAHRITQIAPNSPAAQQGLRVGDYILTVNNQDVAQMNAADFSQFLRTSAQNADAQGRPLLLEVVNEQSYRPPPPIDDSYMRSADPTTTTAISTQKNSAYDSITGLSSRTGSQRSGVTQGAILFGRNQESPSIQLTNPHDERPKVSSTRPTVSRQSSKTSGAVLPIPSQNGTYKSTSTRPYMNGYHSPPPNRSPQQEIRPNDTVSASLYRSRENLSRGTIDLVSRSRMLRYCRLIVGPSQAFGFQLKSDDNKHIIHNIHPDSPAARAGLSDNDWLLEVDDENVEQKTSREVAVLIRNAALNGRLRVLIAPNNVKVLSKRSAKSLTALNDPSHYQMPTVRSKYDDQERSLSVTSRHRSTSRLNGESNYRDRASISNYSSNYLSEPLEPLPRRCVLEHDPSFRGCGFRLAEKENYDTPIVVDVSPNSPAKRSGLTDGDHIIYVGSHNVQNFHSFDDIIHLIQRSFEENGQVILITLTGPAYQVLRKRGGYLDSIAFDYQSSHIGQLKPRLCQLKLYDRENDFGFTLQQNDYLYVQTIEGDSAADIHGLRRDDIVLELNGRGTKTLTINQIKQIIEAGKQERKIDLLVIDPDGYRFSTRHAIPLNSLLSFVQTGDGQRTTINHYRSHEPIYL